MDFSYIECECLAPWHTLRLSWDHDDDYAILEFAVYPKTLWQRVKAAWQCLLGRPVAFSDTLLRAEGRQKLISLLAEHSGYKREYVMQSLGFEDPRLGKLREMVLSLCGAENEFAWWQNYNFHLNGIPADLAQEGRYDELHKYLAAFCYR